MCPHTCESVLSSGSGKSYTMMGSLSDDNTKGIIPRLCDNLFERIAEVSYYLPIVMFHKRDIYSATL